MAGQTHEQIDRLKPVSDALKKAKIGHDYFPREKIVIPVVHDKHLTELAGNLAVEKWSSKKGFWLNSWFIRNNLESQLYGVDVVDYSHTGFSLSLTRSNPVLPDHDELSSYVRTIKELPDPVFAGKSLKKTSDKSLLRLLSAELRKKSKVSIVNRGRITITAPIGRNTVKQMDEISRSSSKGS